MKLQYQQTYQMLLALQNDSIKHINYHRKRARVTFCILAVLIFWNGIGLIQQVLPSDLSAGFIWGAYISVGVVMAVLLVPLNKMVYRLVTLLQYKFILYNEKKTAWPKDVIMTLTPEELKMEIRHNGSKADLEVLWENIEKVSEDNRNLYLYIEELNAIIIPKSNYEVNPEEKVAIEQLLHDKIGHLRF